MAQLRVFLLCVLLGYGGGLLYSALYCLLYPPRGRAARVLADLLFCLLSVPCYLFFSLRLDLPALRLYMFLGLSCGFALYLKSWQKTVAFLAGKVYNYGVQRIQRRKERRECPGKERSRRKRHAGSR